MHITISLESKVRAWAIPPESVETLRQRFPAHTFEYARTPDARAAGLTRADVAYTWILSPAELAAAPRLRWLHTSAVAVETICVPDLVSRGVLVSNTRGVQAVPIAEHTMAVVLALAKRLPFALAEQREARWSQNAFVGDRLPRVLAGQTLGLVGVGTIGREIAARASAFGMRVVAMRRRAGLDRPAGVDEVLPLDARDTFLSGLDVLVVAAPLTPETDGLIDAAALSLLRPGAVLVNIGRARIVDTAALVAALESGQLGGAALDVFDREPLPPDHPLWRCPNVLITPHTSGFRQGHWDEVIDVFSDNLARFERGQPLRYQIDPALGY